jgi:hypothetical protein
MESVSLHSPVVRSSGPLRRTDDMGQYTYDNEEEAYTPRRTWSTTPRYAARVLDPNEYPQAVAPRHLAGAHKSMCMGCALGLAIFACSAASLVITALYVDSALWQVRDAASRITGVFGALGDNATRLARLVSLMEAWLGNTTATELWRGNTTLAGASPPPGGY